MCFPVLNDFYSFQLPGNCVAAPSNGFSDCIKFCGLPISDCSYPESEETDD
jgi:hypothetical protein